MKEIDWIDLYETIMCKLYQRKYDKLFERLSKLSERSYKVENIVRNNKYLSGEYEIQIEKGYVEYVIEIYKKYFEYIDGLVR